MRLHRRIALVVGALTLAVAPAMALGDSTHSQGQGQGNGNGPPTYTPVGNPTPGPNASLPDKAKAYGVQCQSFSKKHVKGEKGTPFSQCVTAMAKAANNDNLTAKQACKELSKKHVKGQKGTPFSNCVRAANQLRKEQHQA
jgi:hypothetical protein